MDLTVLDSDRGSVLMNIGVILEFDSQTVPSLDTVQDLLSARVPGVVRLRQRLLRAPFGWPAGVNRRFGLSSRAAYE